MNDVLEIRSSPQEIKRDSLRIGGMASLYVLLMEMTKIFERGFDVERIGFVLLSSFLFCCIFSAVCWCLVGRKYLCLDAAGVTHNNGWFAKRVLWRDVDVFRAGWFTEGNNIPFLPRNFFPRELCGSITLRDKQGNNLLRIRLDFGTKEERDACKQFFKTSRESSAASMTTI